MPSRSDRELIDLAFPVRGTDVSTEYELQPEDTTPAAANVRAFEPALDRLRGGSRCGVSKAVPATVNGAALVQCLDIIVITDPIATGGGVLGGGSGGAGGGGLPPGGGGSGDFSGSGGFQPTSNDTRSPGGDSDWYTRFRPNTDIEFVQQSSVQGSVTSVDTPFTASVTAGNLLLAVAYQRAGAAGATVAVSDTQGLAWTQVGSYAEVNVGANWYTLSLWRAVAGSSAACTVTSTAAGDSLALGVYEYRRVDIITPNEGSAQGTGAGGASDAVTLGPVTITAAREMAFVAVATNLAGGSRIAIDDTGATDAVSGGTFVNLFAWDFVPKSSDFTFTGHLSGAAAFPAYVAVGGSFRHS